MESVDGVTFSYHSLHYFHCTLNTFTFSGNVKFKEVMIDNLDACEIIHTSQFRLLSQLLGVSFLNSNILVT